PADSKRTWAPYGGFCSSASRTARAARPGSQVGGSRSDSFRVSEGNNTLPADSAGGIPSAPVTASVAFQVLLMRSSTGSLQTGRTPDAQGSFPATDSPSTRAAASICSRRSFGMATASSSRRSPPLMGLSSRASSCSTIRNGVGAFLQHPHVQKAHQVAPKRGRAPHLIVVAAFSVQADDERGVADRIAQRLEMRGKIAAAAFFRRFYQEDTSGKRHALRFERGDGSERAEDGVAIVRRATAIELPVAQYGLPGTETGQPAGEFRLLVEVSVEEHGSRKLAAHTDAQHARAAAKHAHINPPCGEVLAGAPVRY